MRGGCWLDPRPREVLRRGVDFDDVVLAIPPLAHPEVCPSILEARPDWANMCRTIGSAIVLSAQLWFEDDLHGLGYRHARFGMAASSCLPNVVTAPNPLFSWLDQSPILQSEAWSAHRPGFLAMFTGVFPPHLDPLRSPVCGRSTARALAPSGSSHSSFA